MTRLDAVVRSAEFLARHGVESPRLQAEWLLAHVLGLPRLQLYLGFDRLLPPDAADRLRELVRRRGQRVPLQHLLGTANFCGLELEVGPEVLVPRPETELLAERAWQHAQAAETAGPAHRVLDFGTGSGCLALAIAARASRAEVTALDVSPAALAVALRNATRLGLADRITFREGDGFLALPPGALFDLLVSNPPYIPTAEIAALEPEVRDHDPRLALDGGTDGLAWYRRLAAEAPAWLAPAGLAMLEFGDGQAEGIREIFRAAAWREPTVVNDLTGRARFLVARRPAGLSE